MGGVLQDGESVIRNRPEDDRGTQYPGLVQHMDIQHLGNPDQKEGQHFSAEAAEAGSEHQSHGIAIIRYQSDSSFAIPSMVFVLSIVRSLV